MRHLVVTLIVLLCAFPTPAFAQQPGTLVTAESVRGAPGGMRAWQIRYWTTRQDGAPQQATGMVVAPLGSASNRPRRVIAWAHGTWGVVEKCAPSQSGNFFAATPALETMVREGYVVVAPDYPGLGTSTPHPYLIGDETARSVLDAVRATRAMPEAGAGNRFAVWGESQGGHAALWTASEARRYAPDLQLVGAAAAAPPTDLAANLREGSDKNARAMLLSFTLYSWAERFGFSLDGVANRANQGIIRRLAQNNCIELGNKPKLGTILGVVTIARATRNKDLGRIQPWAQIISANSVSAANVPGPLLIAQSREDPLVAPAVTRRFAKDACRRRILVRWIDIPGGDHGNSARDSADGTLAWIGARFEGAPPPDDCRRI